MILPVGGKVGRCGLFFAHFIRSFFRADFFCSNEKPEKHRAHIPLKGIIQNREKSHFLKAWSSRI
jgi:hypothetical protein